MTARTCTELAMAILMVIAGWSRPLGPQVTTLLPWLLPAMKRTVTASQDNTRLTVFQPYRVRLLKAVTFPVPGASVQSTSVILPAKTTLQIGEETSNAVIFTYLGERVAVPKKLAVKVSAPQQTSAVPY